VSHLLGFLFCFVLFWYTFDFTDKEGGKEMSFKKHLLKYPLFVYHPIKKNFYIKAKKVLHRRNTGANITWW